MAETFKRLGAAVSSGVIGTADTLYTCPAATSAIASTILVCNQAATSATYRICISTTTGFESEGYAVFGATIAANDSVFLTLGVTLDATNKYLLTSASANTVSFSVFGVENT